MPSIPLWFPGLCSCVVYLSALPTFFTILLLSSIVLAYNKMLKYFLIAQSSTYVMAVKMVCYTLYNILALKGYCGMNVYTVVNNQTKNLAQVPQHQFWQFSV